MINNPRMAPLVGACLALVTAGTVLLAGVMSFTGSSAPAGALEAIGPSSGGSGALVLPTSPSPLAEDQSSSLEEPQSTLAAGDSGLATTPSDAPSVGDVLVATGTFGQPVEPASGLVTRALGRIGNASYDVAAGGSDEPSANGKHDDKQLKKNGKESKKDKGDKPNGQMNKSAKAAGPSGSGSTKSAKPAKPAKASHPKKPKHAGPPAHAGQGNSKDKGKGKGKKKG